MWGSSGEGSVRERHQGEDLKGGLVSQPLVSSIRYCSIIARTQPSRHGLNAMRWGDYETMNVVRWEDWECCGMGRLRMLWNGKAVNAVRRGDCECCIPLIGKNDCGCTVGLIFYSVNSVWHMRPEEECRWMTKEGAPRQPKLRHFASLTRVTVGHTRCSFDDYIPE